MTLGLSVAFFFSAPSHRKISNATTCWWPKKNGIMSSGKTQILAEKMLEILSVAVTVQFVLEHSLT
jgi:hypothetical protein